MSNSLMGSSTSSSFPLTRVMAKFDQEVNYTRKRRRLTIFEAVGLDDFLCLVEDIRHVDLDR